MQSSKAGSLSTFEIVNMKHEKPKLWLVVCVSQCVLNEPVDVILHDIIIASIIHEQPDQLLTVLAVCSSSGITLSIARVLCSLENPVMCRSRADFLFAIEVND